MAGDAKEPPVFIVQACVHGTVAEADQLARALQPPGVAQRGADSNVMDPASAFRQFWSDRDSNLALGLARAGVCVVSERLSLELTFCLKDGRAAFLTFAWPRLCYPAV